MAESNRRRSSGTNALVERRIVIAISTHSGSQSRYPNPIPVPPTHIPFFSFRSDIYNIIIKIKSIFLVGNGRFNCQKKLIREPRWLVRGS